MGLLESIITRRVGFPAKFICGLFGDEACCERGAREGKLPLQRGLSEDYRPRIATYLRPRCVFPPSVGGGGWRA